MSDVVVDLVAGGSRKDEDMLFNITGPTDSHHECSMIIFTNHQSRSI
jgi:hypothetical protein